MPDTILRAPTPTSRPTPSPAPEDIPATPDALGLGSVFANSRDQSWALDASTGEAFVRWMAEDPQGQQFLDNIILAFTAEGSDTAVEMAFDRIKDALVSYFDIGYPMPEVENTDFQYLDDQYVPDDIQYMIDRMVEEFSQNEYAFEEDPISDAYYSIDTQFSEDPISVAYNEIDSKFAWG